MIAVLTHHWAKPGMFEEARALLDGNGRAQANSPGFVSRTTVLSMTDPTQITSFVVWESAEIYDQWKASPERKGYDGRSRGALVEATGVRALSGSRVTHSILVSDPHLR